MISEAIYQLLINDAPLNLRVNNRVYPNAVSQNEPRPLVVYEQRRGAPTYHLAGSSGLVDGEFAITAIGDSYGDARQVADLVKAALELQRGTFAGTAIDGIFALGAVDQVVTPDDGSDRVSHLVVARFRVWYRE